MPIRTFLVLCFSLLLVLAGVILSVIMSQQRTGQRLRATQRSSSELLTVALHGSFLLAETRHAPRRAVRQWEVMAQRFESTLDELERQRQDDYIIGLRNEFARASHLYDEYAAAYVPGSAVVPPRRVEWLRQQIRGRLAVIAGRAESAMDSAHHLADQAQALLRTMLLATAIALPVLLLGLLIGVNRRIVPALEQLATASEAISHGDLARPIMPQRRDEVGQVAAAMERMRCSLVASTERLERNQAQLQAKNEEVEAFVYAVSHDLRGPLVNLVGFTHELELDLGDLEQEGAIEPERLRTMRQSIGFVGEGARRLEGLINALLRLSRTGREDLDPEACDLGAIVASVVAGHRERLATIGGEVSTGPLPPAWVDPLAMTRVVDNLVTNAIKYRDHARPLRLTIAGERVDEEVRYRFEDNGIGFPPGARDRLFMAFQRYHPGHAEGEGMGLAIVRRLVERSGGTIAIEDRVDGSGTCLVITLPANQPSHEEATA